MLGPQWRTWQAELAAMVNKQLEGMETRLHKKIQEWTESTLTACEELEACVARTQSQLQNIERQ